MLHPVLVVLPLASALGLAIIPRTPDSVRTFPDVPSSLLSALPGVGLGPQPRLTEIRTADPLPGRFVLHLSGLIPRADQVVAYLDDERVGAGQALAVEWELSCTVRVTPRKGSLLRVWVFREGQGPLPLPAVLLHDVSQPALRSGN